MGDKFYSCAYVVEGDGTFPLDMLFYDRACPASEEDSHAIEASGPRSVALRRFSMAGKSGPSVPRWSSHGWRVTKVVYHDGSVETEAALCAANGWPVPQERTPR